MNEAAAFQCERARFMQDFTEIGAPNGLGCRTTGGDLQRAFHGGELNHLKINENDY